jgi:hypothetical protein
VAKAALKEGDIIQALKRALPKGQLVRFNPGPMSPRGISDVLITWNGKEYFCEVKVDKTRTTKNQKRFLERRANPVILHYYSDKNLFKIFLINADIVGGERQDWELISMMMLSKLPRRIWEVRFLLIQQRIQVVP